MTVMATSVECRATLVTTVTKQLGGLCCSDSYVFMFCFLPRCSETLGMGEPDAV